jgi:hypothetical protein
MKIEVLSIPDCPNHSVAIANLREALDREELPCDIAEVIVIDVKMAQALGFAGSPTIRINGRDVEPKDNKETGQLCCRLYSGAGAPSVEALRRFIQATRVEETS